VKLLTVILNWRTPDMTLQAAEAALREMQDIDGAITLVDNDSGDGSEAFLRDGVAARGWPESRVRVLQSGRNGGFGAGNNFGIRAGLGDGTRPDLVYVLNSDAFPDPGAIRALVDYLDRTPAAAFAGSYIHGPEGDTHLTTFRFPSVWSEFEGSIRFGPVSRLLARWVVPVPTPQVSGRVDWLAGASLMMRRSVLDQIGLFDEGYFLYFEETDLCLRAARAGFQTHFVRESSVTHIGSASTGMKEWSRVPDYWYDSRLRYFTKNHGRATAAAATAAHLAGGLLHRLRTSLTGRRPHDPPGFLLRLATHDLGAAFQAPEPPRPRALAE
jgi:GT2 family glycosyltransferase